MCKFNLFISQKSIILHEYIKSHENIFKNKKILEISCGCGLVSFTLSLINADLVIATDLEDILNSNTENNLKLNNLRERKNIKLMPLEWNNKDHMNNLINSYKKIDFIFLSECLYEEAPFEKLLITLIKLAKYYKEVQIFFCYKKRYIYQEKCIEKLKNYFSIENIDRNEIYQDFRYNDNYQFFKIKLINYN